MPNIKLDYRYSGILEKEIMKKSMEVKAVHSELCEMAKDKDEFAGWLTLPIKYDKKEFERIKEVADKIRKDSDVFLVIGIGGSYLGARAVIESLASSFSNLLDAKERKAPQVLYVGNNLSPNYINELIEAIRK